MDGAVSELHSEKQNDLRRMDGFTKMMYSIVMNVVTPASSSVFQLVPSAENSKYRSRRLTSRMTDSNKER